MALVFEQLLTKELGDASYLVGDDSARVAAVVDPQLDVERARRHGVSFRYVVQTHIHEDFLSGAAALTASADGADVCMSGPLPQLPVDVLAERRNADAFTVLDVRSPQEWRRGHIPGAPHVFLPKLRDSAATIDRRKPVAVYCDGGYRASIGASLLQAKGSTSLTSPAAGRRGPPTASPPRSHGKNPRRVTPIDRKRLPLWAPFVIDSRRRRPAATATSPTR